MLVNKRDVAFLMCLLWVLGLGGCVVVQKPPITGSKADGPAGTGGQGAAPMERPDSNEESAKRFEPAPPKGKTAVETAMELSEKYAALSEEAAALRRSNEQLELRKRSLEKELAEVRKELKQTEKELGEANDLLVEMRIELNNWKSDVLGFREEMRDAERAQLEALLRISKFLGAELRVKPEGGEGTAAGSDEPNAVGVWAGRKAGEPND